jgi:hypothetical protein
MATRNLHEKIGSVDFPQLFASIDPPALVRGGTIRKLSAKATLVRGTIMAKSSGSAGDGKLVVLGTTAATNEVLTADCILTDDIEVGTANDENVTVYITGDFNIDAVTVASGYTITEDDKDALRTKGILLGTVQPV